MTVLALKDVAYARAYWGMWIADCPAPYCDNAMQIERDQDRFVCEGAGSCGAETPVHWPEDPDAIELLLLYRPGVKNRNWWPGESLEDLLVQNAEHFCTPPEWEELAAGMPNGQLAVIKTVDHRVIGGLLFEQLESSRTKAELDAARRELES